MFFEISSDLAGPIPVFGCHGGGAGTDVLHRQHCKETVILFKLNYFTQYRSVINNTNLLYFNYNLVQYDLFRKVHYKEPQNFLTATFYQD